MRIYMKKLESNGIKLKQTVWERLVFALFLIRIRIRFKQSKWVFNDLTAINAGAQMLNWANKPHQSDQFIFLGSTPLYDRKKKLWVSRLRTGSRVKVWDKGYELWDKGYEYHVFEIGVVKDSGSVSLQSKNNINIKLFCSVDEIKKVIRD